MIIRPREPGLKVFDFLAGLQRAARSTVRCRFGKEGQPSSAADGFATGWLLTDRLVVTLGTSHDRRWVEYTDERGGLHRVEAEVVSDDSHDHRRLLLLRLSSSLPGRAVSLRIEAPQPGDDVFILHIPFEEESEQLSVGRVIGVEDSVLRHDANTLPGVGGAPIFDSRWRLMGMHQGSDINQNFNVGILGSDLLAHMRSLEVWPEVAEYHRIADVRAAREHLESLSQPATAQQLLDRALLGAAVRWSFDPKTLPEADAARLRKLVINPSAPRWILRSSERERLLRSVGSLARLRKVRGTDAVPERGQSVIDQVLEGPPYGLESIDAVRERVRGVISQLLIIGPPYDLEPLSEESLADWLQVSRWFAGIAPGLPTPNEIDRALKRRRLRTRLERISGPVFKGRQKELARLRSWYKDPHSGPMVVTGIGGMGKSALVARFAAELPSEELLLWLDFDRADLAPDDAVSVLDALGEQAAAQIDGLKPPQVENEDWKAAARQLGEQLASALKGKRERPLLVLDSFEVAQYAERYQELWPVLETISIHVPGLRVLVTGRAQVKDLVLHGWPAETLVLSGLAPLDAEAWLREKGIQQDDILTQVLKLARGMPLILVLAVRLVEAGGNVMDLPENLPQKVVEGVVYQRILDRLQDFALRPLAMGALVLRRLTADMIQPVLGGLVELPERKSSELIVELAREMALVEGTDVLWLRSDVRSAALRLLEQDKQELVLAIDVQAAAWYGSQDLTDPTIAAERIYHCLRIGDFKGAETAWRDEFASFFQFEAEEFPKDARAWLKGRTTGDAPASAEPTLASWEQDAEQRIRAALSRGLWRALPEILGERRERSNDSPLVFFDAYAHWRAGNRAAAQKVLDDAGTFLVRSSTQRNRAALSALLAAQAGDRRTADAWLERLDRIELWQNRSQAHLEAQAVRAARVRLTVDLDAEIELLDALDGGNKKEDLNALRGVLSSADVVLPRLRQLLLAPGHALEAFSPLAVEPGLMGLAPLNEEIRKSRANALIPPDILERLDKVSADESNTPSGPWDENHLPPGLKRQLREVADRKGVSPEFQRSIELSARLTILGGRRWSFVTLSPFLSEGYILAAEHPKTGDPLLASIAGTLALFGGNVMGHELRTPSGSVSKVVERCLNYMENLPMRAERVMSGLEVLRHINVPEIASFSQALLKGLAVASDVWVSGFALRELFQRVRRLVDDAELCLAHHLFSPDPLETLVHQLAGLPSYL